MRESDWSRANLLRSDWLGPGVAMCTTELEQGLLQRAKEMPRKCHTNNCKDKTDSLS